MVSLYLKAMPTTGILCIIGLVVILYITVFSVKGVRALAGVAQWIEHWPENQRVRGSIPSHGTCLGCRPGHQ